MRVCYDNLIEEAIDLELTNLQNDSFVEYLYDPYLELACFCTTTSSVLTGRWADGRTINAVAIGYHNCDFARIILKNINGDQIYNQFHALETGDSVYYLPTTMGVYSFEIQLSGGEPIYIGYLFFGQYVEFSRFRSMPTFPFKLRSSSSKSLGGQVHGVFANPLKGYKVTWPRVEEEEQSEMIEFLTAVQTCKPHMLDLYPEAHEKVAPVYANVVEIGEFEKRDESGFYYEFSAEWEEAR